MTKNKVVGFYEPTPFIKLRFAGLDVLQKKSVFGDYSYDKFVGLLSEYRQPQQYLMGFGRPSIKTFNLYEEKIDNNGMRLIRRCLS